MSREICQRCKQNEAQWSDMWYLCESCFRDSPFSPVPPHAAGEEERLLAALGIIRDAYGVWWKGNVSADTTDEAIALFAPSPAASQAAPETMPDSVAIAIKFSQEEMKSGDDDTRDGAIVWLADEVRRMREGRDGSARANQALANRLAELERDLKKGRDENA